MSEELQTGVTYFLQMKGSRSWQDLECEPVFPQMSSKMAIEKLLKSKRHWMKLKPDHKFRITRREIIETILPNTSSVLDDLLAYLIVLDCPSIPLSNEETTNGKKHIQGCLFRLYDKLPSFRPDLLKLIREREWVNGRTPKQNSVLAELTTRTAQEVHAFYLFLLDGEKS